MRDAARATWHKQASLAARVMALLLLAAFEVASLAACSGTGRRTRVRHGESASTADFDAGLSRAGAVNEHEEPARTTGAPVGRSCGPGAPCHANETCASAPGCGAAGVCVATARCSGAMGTFCDCDGRTIYAPAECPNVPYAHAGACEMGAPLTSEELGQDGAGATCDSQTACGRNRVCHGIEGCTTTWTCERVRACSRDTQWFCGCDGQSFRASMNCPGKPFRYRGMCDTVAALRSGASETHASTASTSDTRVVTTTAAAQVTSAALVRTGVSDPGGALNGPPPSQIGRGLSAPAEGSEGARPCATNRDCRAGEICEGDEGCGMTWYCVPRTLCSPDTQYFCDCNGRTFRASMQCPGRPYEHRGSCD